MGHVILVVAPVARLWRQQVDPSSVIFKVGRTLSCFMK